MNLSGHLHNNELTSTGKKRQKNFSRIEISLTYCPQGWGSQKPIIYKNDASEKSEKYGKTMTSNYNLVNQILLMATWPFAETLLR